MLTPEQTERLADAIGGMPGAWNAFDDITDEVTRCIDAPVAAVVDTLAPVVADLITEAVAAERERIARELSSQRSGREVLWWAARFVIRYERTRETPGGAS